VCVCVCLIVCDPETSRMSRLKPEVDCGATKIVFVMTYSTLVVMSNTDAKIIILYDFLFKLPFSQTYKNDRTLSFKNTPKNVPSSMLRKGFWLSPL